MTYCKIGGYSWPTSLSNIVKYILKWKGKGQGKDKEIIIGFSEVKDNLQ
jgi:hypothetical protein